MEGSILNKHLLPDSKGSLDEGAIGEGDEAAYNASIGKRCGGRNNKTMLDSRGEKNTQGV